MVLADWGKPGPLDDADINAGALMGFVIVVQLMLAVGVGSLVGLVFAGISLKKSPRFFSFGTAALLLNLIPVVGVIIIYLRGPI
jgi:predicted PurR-regulated permease PerM